MLFEEVDAEEEKEVDEVLKDKEENVGEDDEEVKIEDAEEVNFCQLELLLLVFFSFFSSVLPLAGTIFLGLAQNFF